MVLQTSPQAQPIVTWEPLPDDYVLPDDPVENIQQPPLAAALTDALGANEQIRPEMLIGSNFGIVAAVRKKIVVKAPDWFYVPQVHPVAEGVISTKLHAPFAGSACRDRHGVSFRRRWWRIIGSRHSSLRQNVLLRANSSGSNLRDL